MTLPTPSKWQNCRVRDILTLSQARGPPVMLPASCDAGLRRRMTRQTRLGLPTRLPWATASTVAARAAAA